MHLDLTRPVGAIVVGRAGMDLYPVPDGSRIESAVRFETDIGGSAANIAVALARQGVRVMLASPLSADGVGRHVRGALTAYSVDMSRSREVTGDFRTSLALAETRADDAEVVIYRNGAADFALEPADVDEGLLRETAVLIVTGTALAREPSRGASFAFLETARRAGTFAILDIDHRRYSWASPEEAGSTYAAAARLAAAVVGNDDEFAVIAGSRDGALDAARGFVEGGADVAIFKKGVGGSLTITPDGSFETPIFPVTVMKPFGAGDAFMGGLVAALLAGQQLATALTRGTAAAALVVARRGCAAAMPDPAAIDALIAGAGRH